MAGLCAVAGIGQTQHAAKRDDVSIPGLVREYLARLECEKMLATEAEPTVESAPAHAAVAEEGR